METELTDAERKAWDACRAQLADARAEMGKITEYIEFMFRGVTGRNMNADEIIKYMQEQDSEYEDKREEVDVLRAQLAACAAERDSLRSELNKWQRWEPGDGRLQAAREQAKQNSLAAKVIYINGLEHHIQHIGSALSQATARAERAEAEVALLRAALNVDFASGTGALGNPPYAAPPADPRGAGER